MKPAILASMLLALLPAQVFGAPSSPEAATLKAMQTCRINPAPLERLDCYDRLLTPEYPNFSTALIKARQQGDGWLRAFAQENLRDDHSTTFLTRQTDGEHPSVIITTPALGNVPPRPVLMFSCIDNITRLQIALPEPLKSEPYLTITTDKSRFDVHWFLRENDSLLESSRGLAGIDEIKQLFGAKTLTIAVKNTTGTAPPALTFAIADLEKTLEPLQAACHWAD